MVKWITQIIPGLRDLEEAEKVKVQEEIMQPIVRKLAHFSIYTLLGILTMSCALTYKGTNYQRGLITFLFGLLYACSDEFHQLFITGRSCEFRDICIDSLGVITGIVCIYVVYRIYRKMSGKKQERQTFNNETKILFISSTGGHFSELMQLQSLFPKCNYHIVTEKTPSNCHLKEKYKEKINFLPYGTKKTPLKYLFILFANCFMSLWIYLKFRPQVVITTGTHTAGPMCCIAKLLGSRVIYIETFANRKTKTQAGKLLYYVADTFVVQWEEMLEVYPKAKYWGWIY